MDGGEPAYRRLIEVLKELQRELGRSVVALLGEEPGGLPPMEGIPTGWPELDEAMGGFGIPRQRISELYGPPASGKTALGLALVAAAQRAGGVAAFIDVEHTFEPARAEALGVDTGRLVVAQPETGEQALFIAEELVRSAAIDLLVLDSVAALVPEAELDGRVGEAPNGLQARLMGQALRRLTVGLRRARTAVVLLNHLRPGLDGKGSSTAGGNSLPFFAAVRVEVGQPERLLDDGRDVGVNLVAHVVKNKVGPAGSTVRLALRRPPEREAA